MPLVSDWMLDGALARLVLGAIAAIAVSVAAWRARALTADGLLAASLVGTAIVGAGGWWAGLLLIAFFTTSSVLSRTGADRARVPAARGSRRDAVQVAANGGVAGACALFSLFGPASWWLLALSGSIAAATADTWSSEIGRRAPVEPRLITTGRPVPAGTSGAISRPGTVAALLGGTLIGALTALGVARDWTAITSPAGSTLFAVGVAGITGSLMDSLLGATVQEQRWCPHCDVATERVVHRCGTSTCHHRGLRWVTNDTVNLACVLAGAAVAVGIARVLASAP